MSEGAAFNGQRVEGRGARASGSGRVSTIGSSRGLPADLTARLRQPAPQGPAAAPGVRQLWGIDDVADYLGVPKQTIYSWRQTGYGPKAIRVGKHLRWRPAVVIEWTLGPGAPAVIDR